jgi:hypothetical protein
LGELLVQEALRLGGVIKHAEWRGGHANLCHQLLGKGFATFQLRGSA